MANAPSLAATQRNGACDLIVDALDAGTPPGKIKIYSGTMPADVDTALSGNTLLAAPTFSNPAYGSSAAGVAVAAAITSDTNAAATGTATFFRQTNGAGVAVIQGTVGTSGCDLNLSSVSIVAGGTVGVSSLTYTHAAS